jgi:2,4-dienoyl-CoA reductase-like NADH-dependent reductase (Old Yellow Enzyme family)
MKGLPFTFAMRRDDMTAVIEQFTAAATRARESGFDAVELHLGHGYLLSQFMSPRINRRRDAFGGSLANRMRFPLEVVRAVRAALAPEFPVLAKMNVDDGVRGGLDPREAADAARMLEDAGTTALVLSGGLVNLSPMFLMRGSTPLAEMIEVEPSRLQKLTLRLVGPKVIRARPFTPLFFLEPARLVRAAVRMPLVLVGGVKSLAEIETALDAGFDLVAMGRALLHDPTLPERYRSGAATESGCVPCNVCMTEMDRAGGVCCARVAGQLARRATEVASGLHREPCGEPR